MGHKESMFESIRKEFFYAVLLLLATAAVSYLYHRYTVNELEVDYTIVDIKIPVSSSLALQNKNGKQQVNKLKAMRILVKNQTERPVAVTSIEAYGLKDYYGVNVSRVHNEQDEIYNQVAIDSFEKNEGKLIITHFDDLPSKREYEIFILGNFYPVYVQVKSDLGIIVATKTIAVRGIELFFARYWSLVIVVTVLSMALVVYYYKSKNVSKS